ncbi:MAG TPA: CoA pyrophosphatase [Dongiaceae bacterium]|nr:CoA pyrophosphatase [Dongiaceae bacterium]
MRRPDIEKLLAKRNVSRLRGDHDLNPGWRHAEGKSFTEAAVLVPLLDHSEGVRVLLTRRTDNLSDHPGQISFPGGRRDSGDVDAAGTALREAQEEIGLDPRHVEIIAELDPYRTRTGFLVYPIVGFVNPLAALYPNPLEVAEIFDVPLAHILDPNARVEDSHLFEGQLRYYYAYLWQTYYIWGATAGMLANLAEFLRT